MSELDDLFTRVAARSAAQTSLHLADVRHRAEVLAVRRRRQRSVAGAVIVVVVAVLGVVAVAAPRSEHRLEVWGGAGSSLVDPTPGTTSSPPGTRPEPAPVYPLPPDLLPSPAHPVAVRAFGTVVDLPGHPRRLCFHTWPQAPADTYCEGVPLTGNLDGLPPLAPKGDPEAMIPGTTAGTTPAAGVRTTGIVTITGRYDGSSLTSTAPVVTGVDPATDRDYPSYSDCPPPPAGWAPARRGSPTDAEALARSLPGYESSRMTGPLDLAPTGIPTARDGGFGDSLLLVTFADHADENADRLRAAYDGPLCVTTAQPYGPPAAIAPCQDPRLRCKTVATEASGRHRVYVVYGDQRMAQWFAGLEPHGTYEVLSYLHPLP